VYKKPILPQFFHDLSNSLKTRFKWTRREYELHMGVLSSQNIVYLGFSSLGLYNWITLKYISGFSPKIYIYRFCFWKPRELEKKQRWWFMLKGMYESCLVSMKTKTSNSYSHDSLSVKHLTFLLFPLSINRELAFQTRFIFIKWTPLWH
jgi:hypothetical protein